MIEKEKKPPPPQLYIPFPPLHPNGHQNVPPPVPPIMHVSQ